MRTVWLSLILTIGVDLQRSAAQTQERTTDPKHEISRIISDIEKNYSQIHTVRAILQTTHTDRTVKKREEITNDLPGGGTVHITRSPSWFQRERILLDGDDLLREPMGGEGDVWGFRKGIYTQYSPKFRKAWLMYPDQMPGILPLDPRNLGSIQQKQPLIAGLKGDRVIEIRPMKTTEGLARISVLLEQTFGPGLRRQYRCEFDPARHSLPTRLIDLRVDNKLGYVIDIEYQEVIPGSAWFLKSSTCKFFGVDGADSPDSDAWKQSLSVETTGKVHVNTSIPPEALVMRLPEGTEILDSTKFKRLDAPKAQ